MNRIELAFQAWDKLDLANQSDIGTARAWFLEGFVHGYETRIKTFSDEEITAIWQTDECYQNAQAFARAILRKAQEK